MISEHDVSPTGIAAVGAWVASQVGALAGQGSGT
jgi:hypothetical protein